MEVNQDERTRRGRLVFVLAVVFMTLALVTDPVPRSTSEKAEEPETDKPLVSP